MVDHFSVVQPFSSYSVYLKNRLKTSDWSVDAAIFYFIWISWKYPTSVIAANSKFIWKKLKISNQSKSGAAIFQLDSPSFQFFSGLADFVWVWTRRSFDLRIFPSKNHPMHTFIGPKSDHCQPLSLTDSLLFSGLDWCNSCWFTGDGYWMQVDSLTISMSMCNDSWSLGEILKLKFSQDFEAGVCSRF